MPIRAACPNPDCRRSYNLADGLATPTARCPACRTVLTYPDTPAPVPDTLVASTPSQQPVRDHAGPAARPGEPTDAPTARGYKIEGEIARGGMGVVYRARELALRREVAIKVLRPGIATHREALRRFV